ncbi:cytochrome C [Sulfurovum sp.]|uniref:cytochrome C n=1 Tax=Sulfurovum sp. TaxID=1969726 RepID=UPI00356590CD
MNNVTKLAVAALLGLTVLSSTASADVKKGQKIYLKKLKAPCNIGGATFAQKHTQDEWEAIHEAGKFADEVMKICPKVKKVKAKYIPDVYDFVYEYASDSGNVPAC